MNVSLYVASKSELGPMWRSMRTAWAWPPRHLEVGAVNPAALCELDTSGNSGCSG